MGVSWSKFGRRRAQAFVDRQRCGHDALTCSPLRIPGVDSCPGPIERRGQRPRTLAATGHPRDRPCCDPSRIAPAGLPDPMPAAFATGCRSTIGAPPWFSCELWNTKIGELVKKDLLEAQSGRSRRRRVQGA